MTNWRFLFLDVKHLKIVSFPLDKYSRMPYNVTIKEGQPKPTKGGFTMKVYAIYFDNLEIVYCYTAEKARRWLADYAHTDIHPRFICKGNSMVSCDKLIRNYMRSH